MTNGAAPSGAPVEPAAVALDPQLVAQGKARFQANKCYECHGANGQGTDDGPDLTKLKLTGAEIAAFLEAPSVDAQSEGMPDIPRSSPESPVLVAYVLSLRPAR
jgi:mono/diheme cytochrome c family protein